MTKKFNHTPDIIKAADRARKYSADPNMKTLLLSRLRLFEKLKQDQDKGGTDETGV